MYEKIIIELLIAIVISIFIYKFFLKAKESNRGILNQSGKKVNDFSNDTLRNLVRRGNKIGAIKLVRQNSSLSLKDAKEFVDALERGENPPVNFQAPGPILRESYQQEVLTLLREGKKLEAIKLVRLKTKSGLKEAKKYVESLE